MSTWQLLIVDNGDSYSSSRVWSSMCTKPGSVHGLTEASSVLGGWGGPYPHCIDEKTEAGRAEIAGAGGPAVVVEAGVEPSPREVASTGRGSHLAVAGSGMQRHGLTYGSLCIIHPFRAWCTS